MEKTTIKEQTITAIKKVLRRGRKYYVKADFPFVHQRDGYMTHQGRVFKEFMHSRGYMWVSANEIDIEKIDNRKLKSNNTVVIKPGNYIQYKKKL